MPHFGKAYAPAPADRYAAVCEVLWAEREILEALACDVVMRQLVAVNAGAQQPRQPGVQEEHLLERLRLQEVLREAMVEALTNPYRGEITLAEIVSDAPEPWATMLSDHGTALRALVADLGSLSGFDQRSLSDFLA